MCTSAAEKESSDGVPPFSPSVKPPSKTRRSWPEDDYSSTSSSCVSRQHQSWTYSYMRAILAKGARQTDDDRLTLDDLYRVPSRMESRWLSREFRRHHAAAAKQSQMTTTPTKQLLVTLWHLAAPTFVPAGFCQLLTVLCQVGLPLLVRELLQVIERYPNERIPVAEGVPYAVSIFAVAVINAFGNHRHRHLALQSGIVLRAATINTLYEHVLRLTPRGHAGLTAGQVTNLMATDTQKLFEVTQEGHLIWSLPLAVVLVTVSLVLVMGPTTLVGVAVLILFVPLVERITARMLAIRHQRVAMTDQRVGVVSAMLQGVRRHQCCLFVCLFVSCHLYHDVCCDSEHCVLCVCFLTCLLANCV